MKMSSTEQMRLLNGELIPALSTYLQAKGYQIKKVDEEGMLKVADQVLDDLARHVEQHAESTRPRAQAR